MQVVFVGALDLHRRNLADPEAPAWTWSTRVNGLPEAAVEDLALYSRDGLRLLRAGIASRGIWELRLDIADDVRIGDPQVAEALLRMVQEALTNSARHGQARHLDVAIRREGSRIVVCIEDDGRLQAPLRRECRHRLRARRGRQPRVPPLATPGGSGSRTPSAVPSSPSG